MSKIAAMLLSTIMLLSAVSCNKTPPDVPDNTDENKENKSVEEQLLSYDSYDVFEDEIYLCDDVYRSDDTRTHGTGSISLPMGQEVLEVKDYDILLCGDGCSPESVVSRASQGYAPAYYVVPDGEMDGNYKVLKFKMEIPEPMLEDIKKQGVYEQITEEIESQYYYLLVLDEKHYAYINLERIEGAEKLEHEAELADSIVKNAKVTFEPKNEKLDLTIERVVRLAENKGEALTWSDFQMYNAIETGSGLYILVYEIDEAFDLMIGGSSPVSSPMYIRLVTKADRDNYIDIRTEDVEIFISENQKDNQASSTEIQIGAYVVSPVGEELRVRDIDSYKEYAVSLSFCVNHTVKEGAFYWITGILDSEANHITVEFPDNFHSPQRYQHTEEGDLPLSVYATNVTNTGLKIRFELAEAPQTGNIQTGDWYEIEKYENDEWKKVETVISNYGFDDIAYLIKENDITEFEVNWEWLYGKLSPGRYRIIKEIIHFRETGNFDKKLYEACFVISDKPFENNLQSKEEQYSKVTEISVLPDSKENAIVTGTTVGGFVEFYCFTPGLKYYRYDSGTEKYYECEVYLPETYEDGEIIYIRPGAGSGEIEIIMRAVDENGNVIYPAYLFASPIAPLDSQPSSRAVYDEQELIDSGINTELLCGYPKASYFTPITLESITKDDVNETECHVFVKEESEYTQYLLLQPSEELSDISLSLMELTDEGFVPGEKLYTLDKLNSDKPLVVGVVFYGDFTTYGLSFTGAQGNEYNYTIYTSGKDGSVILQKQE